MGIIERFEDTRWSQSFLLLASLYVLYTLVRAIYNLSLHALAAYPGPLLARATSLPMVWNLFRGYHNDWIIDCHRKYGYVVRVSPGELSYISQEAWRDIYGHDSPASGRKWEALYRKDNPMFANTMISADDESHARQRRMFNPAFSEKNLREQEPALKETAKVMVDRIERFHKENPTKPIDMANFFMCITFDVMGNFTLSKRFGLIENMEVPDWMAAQQKNVKAAILIFSAGYLAALKPIISFFMWLFDEQLNASLTFTTKQVEQRLKTNASKEHSDILAFALREDKLHHSLTPLEMNSSAMLFLNAGFDTTATAMTGLLWYLHVNPKVSSDLTTEIRNEFQSLDDITLQRCMRLPYLQACIEEGLRMHSPVKMGLPRVTPPEGMVIVGKFVPGQTIVYASPQAANLSPENFQDPETFLPERWIDAKYASDKKGARQPFSVGVRDCPGKGFAYHEMRFIIATLIFSFDIYVKKESDAWGMNQKVYITPERRPLWVEFKKRI